MEAKVLQARAAADMLCNLVGHMATWRRLHRMFCVNYSRSSTAGQLPNCAGF